MDKKFYLDENGVIKLLQGISKSINDKTSSKIKVNTVEDPETGEIHEEIENPKNFATTEAVVNYVAKSSREKLSFKQQSTKITSDTNNEENKTIHYSIETNNTYYDGSEQVQVDLNLINEEDIINLFMD